MSNNSLSKSQGTTDLTKIDLEKYFDYSIENKALVADISNKMKEDLEITIKNISQELANNRNLTTKKLDNNIGKLNNITRQKTIEIIPSLQPEHQNNFFLWQCNLYQQIEGSSRFFIAKNHLNNSQKSYENKKSSNDKILRANQPNSPNIPDKNLTTAIAKELRAQIDMSLLYAIYHCGSYKALQLEYPLYSFTINLFEKIRLILIIKNSYFGIYQNIISKINEDLSNNFNFQQELSNGGTAISFLLFDYAKSEILPERPKRDISNIKLINQYWQSLFSKAQQKIVENYFLELIAELHNTKKFWQIVLKILATTNQEKVADNKTKNNQNKNKQRAQEPNINSLENDSQENQNHLPSKEEQESNENNNQIIDQANKNQEFIADYQEGLLNNQEQEQIIGKNQIADNQSIKFITPYKVFTSEFDEVTFPKKLIEKSKLKELRQQLDLKMQKLNNISNKISSKLKRKLIARQINNYQENSNEGYLNRKKLTQIICRGNSENIYINPMPNLNQDVALTILLDNSGSMRGNPIIVSSLCCEVISTILEKFSIKNEIIGFTTTNWRGGRSYKSWERAGRPKNPGRINDLRHIIYKSFNQSFKSARINLGLMLQEGILKENIDGEALLFAKSRLMQQKETRKIIMVISDGAPVDDSTYTANNENILTQHLEQVVSHLERRKQVELLAIGIGHKLDKIYRNSLTINHIEDLGDAMINQLADLL
jgi:cobaltochelatase CobT